MGHYLPISVGFTCYPWPAKQLYKAVLSFGLRARP